MSRSNSPPHGLLWILLLCIAFAVLGASFGALQFGCNANHQFKAEECMQITSADGAVILDCSRVIQPKH